MIDRPTAARLGVRIQDIDNALNNAFAQRQISTIYTQRNQYRVVLEVEPRLPARPDDLPTHLCAGRRTARRCRSRPWRRSSAALAPLVGQPPGPVPLVTHQLRPAAGRRDGRRAARLRARRRELHLPDSILPISPATRRPSRQSANSQPLLILAALIAVYIVLGVLYESLPTR